MTEPRARTAEELREDFLAHVRQIAAYWSRNAATHSPREMCDGLAFSILVAIDGHSGGFPCSLDLVCRPHEDDKAFHQAEGENWIEDGTVLNGSELLHDLYYQKGSA